MSLLQRFLLQTYAAAVQSGLMRVPLVRKAFEGSYGVYKGFIEAPYVATLRPYVRRGTTVIDVGANIGFFTRHFAQWTGPGGRVLAIEPEATNFARLSESIRANRLEAIVVTVHAAAVERAGPVTLAVDPLHPGGHHLDSVGVLVEGIAVDDLIGAQSWPPVSLIKIDVQGAELRVLRGASRTVEASRPALLVELDDGALRGQGSSVEEVIDFLRSRGYRPRLISSRGLSEPVEPPALLDECRTRGYLDVLFLHQEAGSTTPSARADSDRPPLG